MVSFGQIVLSFGCCVYGTVYKKPTFCPQSSQNEKLTAYARHYFWVFPLISFLFGTESLPRQNVKGVMVISAMVCMYVLWQSSNPLFSHGFGLTFLLLAHW